MILTCPNCATRFLADDKAIGPTGRRVECDACGAIWMAPPRAPPRPVWEVDPGQPKTNVTLDANEAGANSAPLFVDRGPVARAKPTARVRAGPVIGWVLIVLVVAAAAVAGLLIFQRPIERAFPGTQALYRTLGLAHSGMGVG